MLHKAWQSIAPEPLALPIHHLPSLLPSRLHPPRLLARQPTACSTDPLFLRAWSGGKSHSCTINFSLICSTPVGPCKGRRPPAGMQVALLAWTLPRCHLKNPSRFAYQACTVHLISDCMSDFKNGCAQVLDLQSPGGCCLVAEALTVRLCFCWR